MFAFIGRLFLRITAFIAFILFVSLFIYKRFIPVAMESTTILAVILGLVALMLVFLLYVNRRWCFRTTPAFARCDENSLPSKYVHKMGMYELF